MNAVVAPDGILSTVLHHLDINHRTCVATTVPVNPADLRRYLAELLAEIQTKPQRREYHLADLATQFGTSLAAFFAQRDLLISAEAEGLAQRLLRIELATEAKYGHLSSSGSGHLKKGSFLQFMYSEAGVVNYLGVKVEHQHFLGVADFRRKIGLAESHKIYKACKVSFDAAGAIGSALIFDTNSKPSAYWWRDFWELTEQRTDEHNTECAIREVVRVLGPLKKASPVDYTILRNAAVAAFKQSGRMDFDDFVTNTFQNYQPVEASATPALEGAVRKLRDLPARRNFDSQFNLAPTAVPYRRVELRVTPEISVSYEEGMPNLEEKIWASQTRDGQGVLVIEAPQATTDRFTFKAL